MHHTLPSPVPLQLQLCGCRDILARPEHPKVPAALGVLHPSDTHRYTSTRVQETPGRRAHLRPFSKSPVCPWASVGWGGGCLQIQTHKSSPKPGRRSFSPASWQSTEEQTGPCRALATLRARSRQRLPASRGLAPPRERGAQPREASLAPAAAQLPTTKPLQGRHVSSRCAGERGLGLPSAAPALGSPSAASPGDPVRAGAEPRHPRAAMGTARPCPGRPPVPPPAGLGPPAAPAAPVRAMPAFGFSSSAVPLEGMRGKEDTLQDKGCFLPRRPTPVVTEPSQAVKAFPCLLRSLVMLHLNGTLCALCAIPKLSFNWCV